jgi:hypothetical protein
MLREPALFPTLQRSASQERMMPGGSAPPGIVDARDRLEAC